MRTLAAAAAVMTLALASPGAQTTAPLKVYWIDVEGGAATLIVTPAGESVLVDAGNPGPRDSGRILKTARDLAGLSRLDILVVTHLHNDHFGGVAEVAAAMPVGTLYENGIENAPANERGQATVPAFRDAKVARRIVVKPGDLVPLKQARGGAPLSLRIVAAHQTFASAASARANAVNCRGGVEKPVDATDNANSIAMVVQQGPFRLFLGGDLTWNVEARLVCPDDRIGRVSVYQSVHHGLDLSNNPVLVRTLQPQVVVFNNGVRKGFEPNSVATVAATPSVEAVYQVHRSLRDGAANTADERVANRDEACSGEGIAMTVAPDGKTYAISVPSTGHTKSYRTR